MKIPNHIVKQLKSIAKNIPTAYYDYNCTVALTGMEMIKKNVPTNVNIDTKAVYIKSGKAYAKVNHFNRLKRIYQKSGNEGVLKYVQDQIAMHKEAEQKHENLVNNTVNRGL